MSSTLLKGTLVTYATCFVAAITQVACERASVTLPEHVKVAQDYCASNGGLTSIEDASAYKESESCGYKCSRYTGRVVYEATFTCKNGAHFAMKWAPDVKLPQ